MYVFEKCFFALEFSGKRTICVIYYYKNRQNVRFTRKQNIKSLHN
jgi:hypothetical protein